MMKYSLLFILFALSVSCIAQDIKMKTEDGKTVILKPDGTWAMDTALKKADTDKKVKDVTEAFIALRNDVNGAGKSLFGGRIASLILIGIGATMVIANPYLALSFVGFGALVDISCYINAAIRLKRAGWRAQRIKE